MENIMLKIVPAIVCLSLLLHAANSEAQILRRLVGMAPAPSQPQMQPQPNRYVPYGGAGVQRSYVQPNGQSVRLFRDASGRVVAAPYNARPQQTAPQPVPYDRRQQTVAGYRGNPSVNRTRNPGAAGVAPTQTQRMRVVTYYDPATGRTYQRTYPVQTPATGRANVGPATASVNGGRDLIPGTVMPDATPESYQPVAAQPSLAGPITVAREPMASTQAIVTPPPTASAIATVDSDDSQTIQPTSLEMEAEESEADGDAESVVEYSVFETSDAPLETAGEDPGSLPDSDAGFDDLEYDFPALEAPAN